jgi:hypothetical protein
VFQLCDEPTTAFRTFSADSAAAPASSSGCIVVRPINCWGKIFGHNDNAMSADLGFDSSFLRASQASVSVRPKLAFIVFWLTRRQSGCCRKT